MKTLTLALLTLVAPTAAAQTSAAQKSAAEETKSHLAESAARELADSTAELTRLRSEIAAEKLPMAQELTALEEKLSALRREHESVTRAVDTENLSLPGLTAEIKAREDELTYVGNLLDEYARTFDSKVHVSELQYCGEAIAKAKGASEDAALTQDQRFGLQNEFVGLTVKRLFDALGGMRFEGTAVDLEGVVTRGQYALLGPVALFSAGLGAAGVVVPQTGSQNPLVRPLEGALQAGLVALVQNGEGLLPLDPSRGAALKALVQKTNLWHIFLKGGPIMWPILAASIVALGVVLERLLFLFLERMRRDRKALDSFFAMVQRGAFQEAIALGASSRFYVVRALGYALGHKEQSLASAVLYATSEEMKRFKRGIPVLDTVITLAPLLGLLGTVTGMMASFSVIGGELDSPGAITGGIAEALIATACGLGIAILSLMPFNFLNTKLEEARIEIESAGTQLELLVQRYEDEQRVPERVLQPAGQPAGNNPGGKLQPV